MNAHRRRRGRRRKRLTEAPQTHWRRQLHHTRPLPVRVSRHAKERYQERVATASDAVIVAAWRCGRDLDPDLVAALTQCNRRGRGSRYRLTPDHKGILVGVVADEGIVLTTCLRVHEAQRRILEDDGF